MSLDRSRWWAFFAARGCVLLLLCAAAWDPLWRSEPVPQHVTVVVDDSLSVAPDALSAAWSQAVAALSGLADGSTYSVVRFAAGAVLEVDRQSTAGLSADVELPRRRRLATTATNIELGLRRSIAEDPGTQKLLVITDGVETVGDARPVLQALRGETDIYFIDSREAGADELHLERVAIPDRVTLDSRLPVLVAHSNQLVSDQLLSISVDGRKLEQKVIESGDVRNLTRFELTPDYSTLAPGEPLRLQVAVTNTATGAERRLEAVVNVDSGRSMLYLRADTERSVAADSLLRSGWSVREVTPAGFLSAAQSNPHSVVVMDNVSAMDMSEQAWTQLAENVGRNGAGLVVLGGDRSFGAGGYRHSSLEQLLPVLSESATPMAPSAVLFLVDKSGSMEHGAAGASRFSYARVAVEGTAGMLERGDSVGLIAFDSQPESWLALDKYSDAAGAVAQAWNGEPSGGTRLLPALLAGVKELATIETTQRILVLLTDGFASEDDMPGQLRRDLDLHDIELIVIAVGQDPDLDRLRSLASGSRDILLRAGDVTTLPRLVSHEVGRRRFALYDERVSPVGSSPLPFLSESDDSRTWPEVSGFLVTRQREQAVVYLETPEGEPLLAAHQYGLGRVVALPLLQASAEPLIEQLISALAGWAGAFNSGDRLSAEVVEAEGETWLEITELEAAGDWRRDGPMSAQVAGPQGGVFNLPLERLAPGQLRGRIEPESAGIHRVSISTADTSLVHSFLPVANRESTARVSGIADWVAAGLGRNWMAKQAEDLHVYAAISHRQLLILAALFVFLAILAAERLLPDRRSRPWRRRGSRAPSE